MNNYSRLKINIITMRKGFKKGGKEKEKEKPSI